MSPGRRATLRRLALPVLILAAAGAAFVILRGSRPALPPVEPQEPVLQVSVVEVNPGPGVPSLLLYATVEAPHTAELRAAVAADVLAVPAEEGRAVGPGEELVVLDERDIRLALRQREAELAEVRAMMESEEARHAADIEALERERTLLELARRGVTRAEDLRRRDLAAESALDTAREALQRQALALNTRELAVVDHGARMAQLQARQARIEAQRDRETLDLQRNRIAAPFHGRVSRVTVAPGDRVRPGDALVRVYDLNRLELRAQVPYRVLPRLREALARGLELGAELQVDGTVVPAVVDRLAGEAAGGRGGVDALLRVGTTAQLLLPGRLLPLLLRLPPVEAVVALPFQALYGLDHVYRLEGGRLARLAVERVGEVHGPDGSVSVLVRSEALRAGDRIVATQLPGAVDGLKVTVAGAQARPGGG